MSLPGEWHIQTPPAPHGASDLRISAGLTGYHRLIHVTAMNMRHMLTTFSRLNLSKAAREAAALKAEFRREDEGLRRQGRGAEVVADRKRSLGGSLNTRAEVLTINGVRVKR